MLVCEIDAIRCSIMLVRSGGVFIWAIMVVVDFRRRWCWCR